MGLLEKAQKMQSDSTDLAQDPIKKAVGGLRARAEEFRKSNRAQADEHTNKGIVIHGLFAKAKSMREQDSTPGHIQPIHSLKPESAKSIRPPSTQSKTQTITDLQPAHDAKKGLLARADRMLAEDQSTDEILPTVLEDSFSSDEGQELNDDLLAGMLAQKSDVASEPVADPQSTAQADLKIPPVDVQSDGLLVRAQNMRNETNAEQLTTLEDSFSSDEADALNEDILEAMIPLETGGTDDKSQPASIELPEAESGGGLLSRAESMREDSEIELDTTNASILDLGEDELFGDLDEDDLPPAKSSQENILGIDDVDDPQLKKPLVQEETVPEEISDELFESEKIFDEQLSASSEVIEHDEDILGVDDLENLESLPELEYTGNSPQSDDPNYRDNKSEGPSPDPFSDWEQEARHEAETSIQTTDSKAEDIQQSEYLFDADSDFTTTPVEAHIASQKKIDHYLSLFDITKEISTIDDFEELWDNLLYALIGEVGAENICIFSTEEELKRNPSFYPVVYSGLEISDDWRINPGDRIYKKIKEGEGLMYSAEFLAQPATLSEMEIDILNTTESYLVVPLKNMSQLYGMMFIGKQIDGNEYSIDDLEFLGLLGEIASVGIERVGARRKFELDTDELRRRNEVHSRMFQLARQISLQKNLDDLYDVVSTHLREDFGITSFSIVLLSPKDQRYKIFAGNQISPDSIEKFSLDVDSDLIARVSNLIRVYDLADFRENGEILANYTNDDLALMSHYWIVPLINLNWLVGFLTIHSTQSSWSELDRELIISVAEITSAVFANTIILNERESLFRDPFSPLENRLNKELDRAAGLHSPVTLVDLRIKNIRKLVSVNTAESISDFFSAFSHCISSFLGETDFMARIGQGRFALILPGRNRNESALFMKKLRGEFRRMRFLPASSIEINYNYNLISAPGDTENPKKMLSILE